jgi:hypothetical protein
MENSKVVIDYNFGMGGVDLSDACLTSYHSTRKRLKKYCQKHFCCLNSNLLYKKKRTSISRMQFEVKLTEDLISNCHNRRETIRESTKTAPPTRINVPH